MGLSTITYALSKKYTDETAAQFGGLKGAPCKVKSVIKQNGQSIVTFEWKNDEGETQESKIYVNDGTPIYNWTPGEHYNVGDLAINSFCFYYCVISNEDLVFDSSKWTVVGSLDGNYDIVENAAMLPSSFSSEDRKMYFCIRDKIFYLWDGDDWVDIQPPSISNSDIEALFT